MYRTQRAKDKLDPQYNSRADHKLDWQSKATLLLFLPVLAAHLVLFSGSLLVEGCSYAAKSLSPVSLAVSAGLAVALGLLVWTTRAATPGGALAGAITVSTFLAGLPTSTPPTAAV